MKDNINIQEIIIDLKAIASYLQARLEKINAVIDSLESLMEDNEDFIAHLEKSSQSIKRTM